MKVTDWVNFMALTYITLPIVATIILLLLQIAGKGITKETGDKLLEFGKWYMVSVAIVFAAKLLDSSFTDRETSIKEIAIYDKYATNILEADNIEKRWKLSEYFAAVTPSEPLRERWEAYKEILKPEYDTLISLKKRESTIIATPGALNSKLQKELLSIKEQQNELNVKLVNTNANAELFVIVFTADTNLTQARYENDKLKKAGIDGPVLVNIGKLYYNISKDFASKKDAVSALDSFRSKVRGDAYITTSSKFVKLNK